MVYAKLHAAPPVLLLLPPPPPPPAHAAVSRPSEMPCRMGSCFTFYIFNRKGRCQYYHEWQRTKPVRQGAGSQVRGGR